MRRVVLFDSPSRIRACRMLSSCFVCFLLISFSVSATAQLPELKDVDLTGWDCFSKLEGAAKTQDGREWNQRKNRSPIELTGTSIPSFHTTAFFAHVAHSNRQIAK